MMLLAARVHVCKCASHSLCVLFVRIESLEAKDSMYEARIHRVLSELSSLRIDTSGSGSSLRIDTSGSGSDNELVPAAGRQPSQPGRAMSKAKAPPLLPADVDVMLIESDPEQVCGERASEVVFGWPAPTAVLGWMLCRRMGCTRNAQASAFGGLSSHPLGAPRSV